ncbi:MAG: S1-C subfamily serine protease, partial [Bacteroidia bacterium]
NKGRNFKVTMGIIPDYLYTGKGLRIDGVKEDRPASKAGLLKGDIVLKMGDQEIQTMTSYMEALGTFDKGQTIPVIVLRKGVEVRVGLTFE